LENIRPFSTASQSAASCAQRKPELADAQGAAFAQAQTAPAGHWDELQGGVPPRLQTSPPTEKGAGSLAATPTGAAGFAPLSREWSQFIAHLQDVRPTALNARMAQLERQVHDNGISYNVYADADRPQRPWSLDLFPLMVDALSWQQIQSGVLQRMRLLEHIMADTYGAQNLLTQGQLPAALVQGHPGYLHAMQGVPPVGGQYLSLAAFDLARGPDGCWWLLSQRTQAPSGLGYLLENRQIISRQFPQAFEAMPVQRLADVYRSWIDGLKQRSPAGPQAHMALLTPGPYNETYFEHAYLARYLGLTLVQGSDLTVRDEHVFLKTLQGLQPVHGLVKRVDDMWLDPLELNAESTLGVPGLLQAVRSGNVLLANAPGSGFLESNALLGFMPALAQSLLGEALQLPAIPSWWCGEQAALQDVLPRLPESVIKPTYPPMSGRSSFEPVIGKQLSQRERDEWAGRILRDGQAHTVQAYLPLSHTPTWQPDAAAHKGSVSSRPVILRVFALADAQGGWQVLPGGLARLGTREGIASMQRGGGSADVWVMDRAPAAGPTMQSQSPGQGQSQSQGSSADMGLTRSNLSAQTQLPLQPPSASFLHGTLPQRHRLVTSRAAENLFWMGRYSERCENTLRLSRLALDVLGSEDQACTPLIAWLNQLALWHGLVAPGVPAALQSRRVFERSLVAGLWDTQVTTGVGYNLKAIHLAAANVRERLSPEHWSLIEQTQNAFFHSHPAGRPPQDTLQAQRVLAQTSQLLAAMTGAQTDRMTRDDGWRLLSIGRHIERLDFLAFAMQLALQCGTLNEQAGFDGVLGLFDSTISFHAQYQQSRTVQALLELLIVNPDNPRALGWVAHTLRGRLARMGHLSQGRTEALAQAIPRLIDTDLGLLCDETQGTTPALQDLLQHCRDAARITSDSLNTLFFAHSAQTGHSVGI
jgi:uncharacterized circularly permuted ATP-grasp superfamily protein/uncharacterized alpha-E superfamily protein